MARNAAAHDLEQRFPALGRLSSRRGARRVPVVQQLSLTECGAACLAMVLAYHGKAIEVDELRSIMGVGRDGASALAILNAASLFGLRGRGVKLEIDELGWLQTGAILHWEFNHFVVFERVRGRMIEIVDPALGRRRVTLEQFGRSFTGVALLLEPSDTFEPEAPGARPIWRQIRSIIVQSGQWSRILVVSLLVQLFALALPVLTGAIVDRVVPRGDAHLLVVLGVGLAGLVAFYFLSSMVRAHLLIQLRTIFDARMTLSFLEHLLRLPYAYFQRHSAGDLMMRINSNVMIREMLTSSLLSTVLDGGLVGIYLILIFVVSIPFGLVVAALALAQLAVFWFSRRRQRELMAETLHTQARSESYLVEMLAGIETLKSTGSELRAGEHWSSLFVDQLNVSLQRSHLNALVDSVNGVLRIGSPLLILIFGAVRVLDGTMSLGTILALCALAGAFLGPLGNLVATATQLQLLSSYVERVEDVLSAEPEQALDHPRLVPTLCGRISLKNVSFGYTPSALPVVRGVSVDIQAGDFVALVGRSGSGKSTLANLLLGLYQPDSRAASSTTAPISRRSICAHYANKWGSSISAPTCSAHPFAPTSRCPIRSCRSRSRRGRQAGPDPRRDQRHADGLRYAVARRRRLAVGRPAAARHARAGLGAPSSDPASRRGDERARRGHRARRPGTIGEAPVHAHRDRPSPEHHPRCRPDPRHGGRAGRRARHSRRAAGWPTAPTLG